jgi:AraC-like DNA-binding protein
MVGYDLRERHMKRVARPLLVLHADERFHERVRAACAGAYEYVPIENWDALEAGVREAPPSAIAIVDPGSARGSGVQSDLRLSPRLRALTAGYPSMPWIAATAVSGEEHEAVRRLGEWGVVQLIAIGHDDTPPAIRWRLDSARGRPMRALLERVLPPETSGRARAIIDAAAEVVTLGGQGSDLAESLRLSRRTLLRWSQRAGIPPARRLLAWMRVLLACALLDDPGRSVLSVARTAGYSSDSGLRRITQKFLGGSPTELRERGAFAPAAAAFVNELAGYRLRVKVTTREG